MTRGIIPIDRHPKKLHAAQLLADGCTWAQVIAQAGVGNASLQRWSKEPEFIERQREIVAARAAALEAEGIANKQNQLRELQQDFDRTTQVMAERGADPIISKAAGGRTGIITRKYRTIPNADPDKPPLTVMEDAVDTGILDARRKTLEQAAKVAGWWDAKAPESAEQPNRVRRIVIEEMEYGDGNRAAAATTVDTGSGSVEIPLPSRTNGRMAP